MEMQSLSKKQEVRLEKRKKKLAALAEIIKLNDKDRSIKKLHRSSELISSSDTKHDKIIETKSNDAIQKTKRVDCDEPFCKKLKIEVIGDGLNHTDPQLIKESKIINNELDKTLNDAEVTLSDLTDRNLTEEQYSLLKRELNERKRALRNCPKLRLKELALSASLEVSADNRIPIFLTDVQNLLMKALIGSSSPCTPTRWCTLEKSKQLTHTVVLIIEGVSLYHFTAYASKFVETNKIFDNKLEIVMPSYQEGKIIEELAIVPLTSVQMDELIEECGSLEAAIESNRDPMLAVRTVFPVSDKEKPNEIDFKKEDKFPRTKLLLSALQMIEENYPLPLSGELSKRYQHYILTKQEYKEVTANSPLFGLDCEMCRTTMGINELTRISIVNENMSCIYETMVRPTNKIVDYLTPYSGITAELMFKITKTLQEVQKDVIELLPPDAILVGQSLNSDLHAMQMMHPYCIDTSVIFNITGTRRHKSKLQTLAKEFLGETIQVNLKGHDSIEDSLATLKLTKLKLSKGIDFGDAVLKGRNKAIQNYIGKHQRAQVTEGNITKEVANNLFTQIAKANRKTAIVSSYEINVDFQKIFKSKANIYNSSSSCDESPKTVMDESKNQPNSNIDCYIINGNKKTIRKSCEVLMDNALTISNINIAPQQLELSRIEKTLTNIDKNINKLWENVSHKGLFVVLLGGVPGASHGVAMLKLKTHSSEQS